MDEKDMLLFLKVFGNRVYELQIGFSAMFNLCVDTHTFTESAFHRERKRLEGLPDFQEFRKVLDKLDKPTEGEDFGELLRKYKGPVQ